MRTRGLRCGSIVFLLPGGHSIPSRPDGLIDVVPFPHIIHTSKSKNLQNTSPQRDFIATAARRKASVPPNILLDNPVERIVELYANLLYQFNYFILCTFQTTSLTATYDTRKIQANISYLS